MDLTVKQTYLLPVSQIGVNYTGIATIISRVVSS